MVLRSNKATQLLFIFSAKRYIISIPHVTTLQYTVARKLLLGFNHAIDEFIVSTASHRITRSSLSI